MCTWNAGKGGNSEATPVVGLASAELNAVEFARRRLGIEPDERQAAVLMSEAKRGILNCTRQWGKSTMAAAKAVYRAFTRPGSMVLVASPSKRQSGEFLMKASGMVRLLRLPVRRDGSNEMSLAFANGSRIVGVPGLEKTVRGFSKVSMLLIDEAARVEDEMYHALRPTECPRIPKEFLEEERRRRKGMFEQEYMTEFVADDVSVFDRDVVERAVDPKVKPLALRLKFGTSTWDPARK
jgi:hypothetical protein